MLQTYRTYRIAKEEGEVEVSTWDSLTCSIWSIFDTKDREIVPVPSDDACNFPECDYERNPTNLYKQIEAKNWKAVNHFLLTGYWSGSFFADSLAPRVQCCTWVTKYEAQASRKRRVTWTHLPIHAAITLGAPEGTIQLMVKIAPPTLRCADDSRMLPLHLAFRRGCPDSMIATIMNVFPEGCAVRDQQGRTPAECAAEGPNKNRGTIIQTVLHYNQRAWEKKAGKLQEEQLRNVRKSLLNRNERIDHLKTALSMIRNREEQTRDSFSLLVAELRRIKVWYDEHEKDMCAEEAELRAKLVEALGLKLNMIQDTAEDLRMEQKKNQNESNRTLLALNAIWGSKSDLSDVAFRDIDEILKTQGLMDDSSDGETADEKRSSIASVARSPSLLTGSDKEKMEEAVNKTVSKTASKMSSVTGLEKLKLLAEADEKFVEAVLSNSKSKTLDGKDEAREEEEEEETPEEGLPNVVSTPSKPTSDKDVPIDRVISEMTSYDMSEAGSYLSNKMKSFRRSLAGVARKSSKSVASKGSSKRASSKKASRVTDLPPPSPGPVTYSTPADRNLKRIEKALSEEKKRQEEKARKENVETVLRGTDKEDMADAHSAEPTPVE